MSPARNFDSHDRSRAAASDDSPQSIRALSAFDSHDQDINGAASPIVPMRNGKKIEGGNVVEQIAYDPAFRNKESKAPADEPQIQPSPRTSSLNRSWDNPVVRDSHSPMLDAFDDFATEEEVRIARNGRTHSFSTASRRESSCHSRRSMASSHAGTSSLLNGSTRGGGGALHGLQIRGNGTDHDALEPLAEEDLDPASFDLVAPPEKNLKTFDLEVQSELLFSRQHLAIILDDSILLQRFTNYLHRFRPSSVPLMVYYLNSLKALKALQYANALTVHLQKINGLDFTADKAAIIRGTELRQKADKAFQVLADQDLPAFITQTYIQTVSVTVKRRIASILPPELQEQSEGLAEVFCLTDPSRPDNPIIMASEQFHETTRYGMNNVIGRNCRFLQGPKTNLLSVKRIRQKLDEGKDHCETFLNYRRDGQPFMNLLMIAPLMDSRGVVRYHIGAQVDVSGLVKSRAGLQSFATLVDETSVQQHATVLAPHEERPDVDAEDLNPMDELRSFSEMLNLPELKTVRESGGALHRIQQEDVQSSESVGNWHKPRVLVHDDETMGRRDSDPTIDTYDYQEVDNGGRLSGVFQHYLLVRPYPSLRVLFASPSLRVPGMLQSPFMDRIGGSSAVRQTIKQAFADGSGITAKVRWTTRTGSGRGRPRWIHCTPLLGQNKAVGVWMVVITDDDHPDGEFA